MNKDIAPALAEIQKVLKKHDMVGLVIVGNATHCDWKMKVDASWSCAWLEADPKDPKRFALRVRSKLRDYPTKEIQKKALEATVGTFVTFSDTLDHVNQNVLRLILCTLARHVDFTGKSITED